MSESSPGAQESYTEVYRACYGAVLRYCRRRRDEESARDATAETFMVAWRRWGEVPDPPLPWLYGVARRILANHDRGARRQIRLAERISDEYSRPADGCDTDGGGRVADALATLSERDQEVLRLSAWEELSPREIGQVLGLTAGTAAVRLHRARLRLGAALDAWPVVKTPDQVEGSFR
ncbi:MAG: sigma-70 family RNA polymerase sigma factor [Austwickia sp.]|nr:sigma-70 family RNA polymerase sigma factor [Austwickia sp.]MCO5310352.1 sigma-70 family RNA polymerase sigma factor [Austwickia sp.]